LQYAALLLLCLGIFCALRHWRWALVVGIALPLNLVPIATLYSAPNGHEDTKRPSLHLVTFNVNFENTSYSQIVTYIEGTNADIVLIHEATPSLRGFFERDLRGYTVFGNARADAFGMLVLSRIPVLSHEIRYLGNSEIPSVSLLLDVDGEQVALLGLHTMPPVGSANAALRDAMLHDAAEGAKENLNAVIAGDFNATAWSYIFDDLLDEGRLLDSARGFGWQPSWPSGLWPMSIEIDHCVHSKTLRTTKRSVGPFLGSDHRPVQVVLKFAAP